MLLSTRSGIALLISILKYVLSGKESFSESVSIRHSLQVARKPKSVTNIEMFKLHSVSNKYVLIYLYS